MRALAFAGLLGLCAWAGATTAAAQATQTYTYDVHGRLIAVATARPTDGVVTAYDYDDADNRTGRQAYAVSMPTLSYRMNGGDTLVPTQLLTSQDTRFTLVLQQDGNLVLYFGSSPLWASATTSGRSLYFQMQADGNAVVYDVDFAPLWASNTGGNSGAYLTLQNDGNLVLRDSGGTTVLWQSNTCCH